MNKPFILFIDSGNKFNIPNLYKLKCELISDSFEGQIVTYGDKGDYKFGNVKVKVFALIWPPRIIRLIFKPFLKIYMILRSLVYSIFLVAAKKMKKQSVDLIVTYDPLTTGVLGVFVSKIFNIPLVVEVNGDYTNWTNYSHISNKYAQKFKYWLAIKTQQLVFKNCSGIKLLYSTQIDWANALIKNKIIKVYPNFLNIEEFKFISERKAVSIIGFPFDVKGIDIAIEAFKLVSKVHPDWNLEILGYYPEHEKQKIDHCIAGNTNIIRLEPIDRKLMEDYVGKTGIVLSASRTEGFPRVIKEAMKARKPCLVSNVGGMAEVFGDNKYGLIFESENIEQLAEKLCLMIENKPLREELSRNAEVFAVKTYSNASYQKNVTEFYSSVVNQKSNGKR